MVRNADARRFGKIWKLVSSCGLWALKLESFEKVDSSTNRHRSCYIYVCKEAELILLNGTLTVLRAESSSQVVHDVAGFLK